VIRKTYMHQRLIPQGVLLLLVAVAIVLAIGFGLLMALGRILAAMGDAGGGVVVDYIALGCGALFVLDLILLVLVLGVRSLTEPEDRSGPKT
jgi:hypothetical protein